MRRPGLLCILFLLITNFVFSQTKSQKENAFAFAKLYGYVRYFHPSDEAAGIDWERFAIYGYKQVEGCKSKKELQAKLTALFQHIAPTIRISSADKSLISNTSFLIPSDTIGYKVVSWQHQGVNVDKKNNRYKSNRTNRPVITASQDNGFGPISIKLNAENFRNKEFIFRTRVKLEKGPGSGHLLVMINKTNSKMGFYDKMENRPIQSGEWKEYEIKGKADSDALDIHLGLYLKGAGELWAENLSLQIKEGDSWKEIYSNSVETEELGQLPKSMNNMVLSYTYQVMPLIEPSPNKWLAISKAPVVNTKPAPLLFKQFAQVGEYIDKEIGAGLRAFVPLALYGTLEQTYPAADKIKLTQLKESLKAISVQEISGSNLYVRLADIAIAWNIFQHFYPYFDVAKTDWQQDLAHAITSAYSDKSEADFLKTLQKLTSKLKDGHVNVSGPMDKALYSPPISWEWVENQLVLTQVFDESLSLTAGDVITDIDGQSPKKYFEQVHQYISAATKGYLDYRARHESLLGEQGSTLTLKVKRADNSTRELTLKRDLPIQQVLKAVPPPDSIKELSANLMYINLATASMLAIHKAMPLLQKSKAIICDLRGYPNSNHIFIENLLTQNDTSSQWMQVPQILYPEREKIVSYQKSKWGLQPHKPHLDAKIIFIIDGRAISYSESYLSFIEHYKLATIVGQPTAGTNGNVNPFTLPGSYRISWTGMKVLKHDGSQHHGVGILPNVLVEKTIKGVREYRDEFLEKAIEIALTNK